MPVLLLLPRNPFGVALDLGEYVYVLLVPRGRTHRLRTHIRVPTRIVWMHFYVAVHIYKCAHV